MTPPSQRVLFLAPVEPWCRENGSSVIIADLLEGLARTPGVDLLPIFMRRPPSGFTPRPPARFAGVTLDMEGRPRWASIARAVLTGSSPLRERFDNDAVARRVAATVREQGFAPTLVHVEHLPLVDIGLRLAREFGCRIVYRAHNVESALWARRLGLPEPLRGLVIRRMEKLEARAVESAALTLCISDVDLTWTRAHAPTARSELFPCSLLIERYRAVEPRYTTAEPQVCFVGGLEWAPNEVGLGWFVREVLPLVLREVPEARLTVLARGATDRPWLVDNPAIRILPQEVQAAELFASSDASIAPLLQGGGVRIKIPESLALGCPVVATTIGSEGLELPGFTSTDEPESFARAVVGHLRQPRTAESRGRMRSAVEAHHGATVLAARLAGFWRDLGNAPARPGGLAGATSDGGHILKDSHNPFPPSQASKEA